MNPAVKSHAGYLPVVTCSLGFGLAVLLLLPGGVTVMNDDFGYLASVLETVRHGRPWTDAWLEPWSASFSSLCAGVWQVTGSFLVATQGVQALCSATGVAGAYLLFRAMDVSQVRSLFLSCLLLTVPTVLWKQVEFTAVALYLPCLLWAVWAALHERWRVFFAVWFLAFASRQSAVTWLALPAWACVRGCFYAEAHPRSWRAPAWVLGAAVPAVLLLHFGMNQSHAQAMLTSRAWTKIELPYTARNVVFGVVAWLVAAGWSGLLQGVWSTGRLYGPIAPRRVVTVVSIVTAVGLLSVYYSPIYFEHDGYAGGFGRLYTGLATASGVAGWLLAPGVIRPGFGLAGLVALVPLALRTNTWDYYYLDVALFGLAAIRLPKVSGNAKTGRPPSRFLGWALLVFLAVYHVQSGWQLKCRVDREYAIAVLTENALRAERLPVTDIGYAPYGLLGWQLHPYYLANEGRGSADTGAFTRYLRRGAASVQFSPMRFWRDSQSLTRLRNVDENRIVASDVFRVGWLWYQRAGIVQSAPSDIGSAEFLRSAAEIRRRMLPLNDREWRAAIP